MSINRFYLPNATVSGLTNWLAGFGQQRQAVHAQEAGMQAQQNRALEQSLGAGILQAGSAIGQGLGTSGRDNKLQGFRLAEIAAQGANALAVQDARRQLPPGFEQDVASIYGFGLGAMPNDGGAGQSVGTPPPLQTPGGMSQQPGPNDAGFFSPSDPGAVQSTPGWTAQPADTKESRDAHAEVRRLESIRDRFMAQGRGPYEEQAFIKGFAPTYAAARRVAAQYPEPQGPPTTARGVIQAGGAIPIPGTSNFFLPDRSTGGYKVSAPVHPDATGSPYGPMASPETVKAYASSRVIDNPDGSKTKVQPDGKVDIEWPSGKATGQVQWDPVKETHEARTELQKEFAATGKPYTEDQVNARVEANRKIAEDQAAQGLTAYPIDKLLSNAAYIIQNDVTDKYGSIRPQKAAELLSEFQRMYPNGASSIPKDDPHREEIIRAVFGLSQLAREQAPVTLP